MKPGKLGALIGAAAAIAVVAPATGASASVHRVAPPRPLVSYTFTMTDHGDSGGAGNDWAVLGASPSNRHGRFTRKLEVFKAPGPGSYTAVIVDNGNFATVPGQAAPNTSRPGTETSPRTLGTFAGSLGGGVGATYSFTASTAPTLHAVTRRVIPGTPSSGKDTTSLFFEQVFAPGTTFDGPGITNFGYAYKVSRTCLVIGKRGFSLVRQSQAWTDTQANSDGQAPGDGQITGFTGRCLQVF